ncbi:hypothetical protein NDU88_002536 [Pleurodeles waltl]|uniref:Uncharacterized protein n=1 Tax=Pleurodeles waltl TaxID=8319 RepID=A0AAV7MNG6_PLEWA|nr:hypothetical protein NDU88_002536 [Pleurodeles waltl]
MSVAHWREVGCRTLQDLDPGERFITFAEALNPLCDGLAGACPHTFPTCAAAAGGEPEPKGSTTNREETPGHRGKTEGQEGWHREFQERRSWEERQTRNETEERKRTSWREPQDGGPERPRSGSSPTGDGRTTIREAERSGRHASGEAWHIQVVILEFNRGGFMGEEENKKPFRRWASQSLTAEVTWEKKKRRSRLEGYRNE